MPTSVSEGKNWLIPRIAAELPGTVLDIGAGEGLYPRLLANKRAGSEFIGVEVFEPYIEEFNLNTVYDRVILGDARFIDFPEADVVILGDVIEHMSLEDALLVWDKSRSAARKAVFASIPLGHHPQGAVNGNEHERHLVTWTNESIHTSLDGIVASWTGKIVGCYAVLPK